jgi:hypothetical protein
MNTQKQAMSKIAQIKKEDKVELSNERVDLSLDQEVELARTWAKTAKSAIGYYQKAYDNAVSQINKAKQTLDLSQGEQTLRKVKQYKKDFEKAGLTNVDVYQDLKLYDEVLEGTLKGVFELDNKIKNIV